MADSHFDFGDWMSIVAGSAVSGIGAAMGWFHGSRKAILSRIDDVEAALTARLVELEGTKHGHDMDIAVLKTNQDNHLDRLDAIQVEIRDMNRKMDAVQQGLTEMLLEIKHRRTS